MANVTFHRGTDATGAPVTDGAVSFNTSTKTISLGNGSSAPFIANYVDHCAVDSTVSFPTSPSADLYLLVLKRGGGSAGYASTATSLLLPNNSCQNYAINSGTAVSDTYYGTPVIVYNSDRKYVLAQPIVTRSWASITGNCTGTTISWKTCPTSASSSEGSTITLNSGYSTVFYKIRCTK